MSGSISGQLRRRFCFRASSSLSSGVQVRFLIGRVDGERRALSTRRQECRTSFSKGISIAAPVAFLTCKYPLTSCKASLDIYHTLSSSSPSLTTTEHPFSSFGRELRGESIANIRRAEGDGRRVSANVDVRLQGEPVADLPLPAADLLGPGERIGRPNPGGEESHGDAIKDGGALSSPLDFGEGGYTLRVTQEVWPSSYLAMGSKDLERRVRLLPRE